MEISISPELESFIREKIESGECADANAVISTALETLRDIEDFTPEETQEIRAAIQPAIESLDRGEGVPWDADEIKARLRRRLDEGP